jgi:site-specific DNA-methyltransferase (adenine-specific)
LYNIEEIKNTIIQGHALDVLEEIPNESIDMVITSPPYWGLRNYNTNPIIWDNHNNCEHEWQSFVRKGQTGGTKSLKVQIKEKENFQIVKDSIQGFCVKCGAWIGELGTEPIFELYIQHLLIIFNEIKRILKSSGSCWVNLGDSYNKSLIKNIKKKSLIGIPDRFKIAMIDDGWICRNEIIWRKPNAMPQSPKDRFTLDYEKLYFFTKNVRYYFEQQKEKCVNGDPTSPRGSKGNKILNSGLRKQDALGKANYTGFNERYFSKPPKEFRNMRSVWTISTQPIRDAHFATFPEKLIIVPIKSSCPENGIVLDIFFGSGTTGLVAKQQNKNYIGIELNPEYIEIANKRLQ